MSEKVKRVVIPIAITLVVAGIAYGVGRFQGHMALGEARAEAEERASELEARIAQAQSELATCEQRAERLEARRRLHMALQELDALNFGYAQRHLHAAGRTLAAAAAGEAEIQELAQEMQDTQIAPTGQTEQQRGRIRELMERLDAALPSAEE